jgi:hypothetical protein
MSSHSVRIAKTLKEIEYMKKVLKDDAERNEYSRGLYNGFELIRSMLINSEPEIITKKKRVKNERIR